MICHACGLPVPDGRSKIRPTPFDRLVIEHVPSAEQPLLAWRMARVLGVSGSVVAGSFRRLVMMGYLTDKYTRTDKVLTAPREDIE